MPATFSIRSPSSCANTQTTPSCSLTIVVAKESAKPLDVAECGEMLLHRLRIAGFTGETSPFTPDAIFEIHKASKGTPRVATQLADNALLVGMVQKAPVIDGFLMHSVISEFMGEEEAA